jgi:signal peptide peptidase-like protein 2B
MLIRECSFTAVELQLYSPIRPVVELSAGFLLIMAVGTIVCSSLWSEFVACEQVDEHCNQLTRQVLTFVPIQTI